MRRWISIGVFATGWIETNTDNAKKEIVANTSPVFRGLIGLTWKRAEKFILSKGGHINRKPPLPKAEKEQVKP